MPKPRRVVSRDKFVLYSAAVQGVDAEVDFFEKVYLERHGKPFHLFREDFCAGAALACEFVRRDPNNRSWGIDLDQPTLDWGRRNWVDGLGDAADRVTLVNADVLEVRKPQVDVVAALNFSYWIFKDRALLTKYFRGARASLRKGGVFVIDIFGGTDSVGAVIEKRKIKDERAPDGTPLMDFQYIWEQEIFNPINHELRCHISFKLADGTRMRRVFTYEWRMWQLPELRELLDDAGFAKTEVWMDGWDHDKDEGDGNYERRNYFDNDPGWLAYLVAYK